MITVIGWDGSELSAEALRTLEKATFVTGGSRHLDALPVPPGARTVVMGNVERALDELERHDGDAVVLASGDPGFFGIVRALQQRSLRYAVVPAVSSVALAFARAGLPWDDALVVSAHGRDLRPVVNACRAFGKVAVLTGPGAGPSELAEALSGLPRSLVVGERLGTADERVTEFSASRPVARDWAEPNVVLVLAVKPGPSERGWLAGPAAAPSGWALPDDDFAHRDGMITKAEVRALVLPRLAPTVGTLVWDVGAGSGSVAVECARFGAAVVAVERDGQQVGRIRTNAGRHGVDVQVVTGAAPAALVGLPDPDAVFVGGGGAEVVAAVVARQPARVVVALAALDRLAPVRDLLHDNGYDVEGTLISASRIAPLPDGSSRLAATNPVLVVSGVRP
ncbi:precorrin-6Y C5,15-methyltransferase (decarboxylating) [Motilibacter peucedani]|uniref:Precorrin-6Y C5,15-methyltransferase (Decarboxylating) n=1 Tax=Motilibacter peucedani TaxID=598650 RepID=A0A420XNN2_9ACTN|nr:precorrin-6y C5,15-methyltransferase (decarboxylating) subunit CbiE [Motilibacter peucedani]RKS73786.1 precorrin-6Y C5,15-methyltransferase (decarboxylating) [Motilibacter peucedani]